MIQYYNENVVELQSLRSASPKFAQCASRLSINLSWDDTANELMDSVDGEIPGEDW